MSRGRPWKAASKSRVKICLFLVLHQTGDFSVRPFVSHSQGTPPGFWDGLGWRLLEEVCNPNVAKLREQHFTMALMLVGPWSQRNPVVKQISCKLKRTDMSALAFNCCRHQNERTIDILTVVTLVALVILDRNKHVCKDIATVCISHRHSLGIGGRWGCAVSALSILLLRIFKGYFRFFCDFLGIFVLVKQL